MDITRRKFFFFGLAAGVGLMLPDVKIELTKEELGRFQYFNPDGGDLGRGPLSEADIISVELEKIMKANKVLFERDDLFYSTIKKKNIEVVSNRQMRVPLKF